MTLAAPHRRYVVSLRANLRQAQALLKAAGWKYGTAQLRNAKGRCFASNTSDSNEGGARVVTPWARNLEKLGIQLNFRPGRLCPLPATAAKI
jgi:microcin C transport system substrate-binding protein